MSKDYLEHIKSGADLQTTHDAIRAGFVSLALAKNRRATPFVQQARALKVAASKAKTPLDLIGMKEIRQGVLTAAGVSDKANNYLNEVDKVAAIAGLIEKYLVPAGVNFIEELVFRFLLTRGDTLGGSMRNVGGFLAQCKLTRSVISNLRIAGRHYTWLESGKKRWAPMPEEDTDIELRLRGVSWESGGKQRTLVYNLTVPLVKNNVDLCLFNFEHTAFSNATAALAASYIALGELKGGIDPARADEHWKTARAAFDRIREAFAAKKAVPKLFFVGAAIEPKMATEIWAMLECGTLHNAANLTNDNQIASISAWICNL